MNAYRHFCYRTNWLNLHEAEALYLERVFAMGRFLENYFVTELKDFKSEKFDTSQFTYETLNSIVDGIKRTPSFEPFLEIDEAFLESHIAIIAEQWLRHLSGKDARPEFRKHTGDQVAWVFDPSKIRIFRNMFWLPGVDVAIPLKEAKIRLFGEPSCYYVHRNTEGQYYLVVLYERVMPNEFIFNAAKITQYASELQASLVKLEEGAKIPMDAALLRKKILINLLATRSNTSSEPAAA